MTAPQQQAQYDSHGRPITDHRAKLIGSATAALLELLFFHGLDTTVKRLMVETRYSFMDRIYNFNAILFPNHPNASILQKIILLYPGLGYSAMYKVCTRTQKYAGQPIICELLDRLIPSSSQHDTFQSQQPYKIQIPPAEKQTDTDVTLGVTPSGLAPVPPPPSPSPQQQNPSYNDVQQPADLSLMYRKICIEFLSGLLIGFLEMVYLPLDNIKVKAQTNPQSISGRSLLSILTTERFRLFSGFSFTAMRNICGSAFLFGTNAYMKYSVYRLHQRPTQRLTWKETALCSAVASWVSLFVSCPFDVIKTRKQSLSFGVNTSGLQLCRNLINTEGYSAFYKGFSIKCFSVAPKLAFGFTIAQYLTSEIDAQFKKHLVSSPQSSSH